MGASMDPNLDNLLSASFENRKKLVGDTKTDRHGLSRPPRGLNWTQILKDAGLEAPGYHETIEKMKKEGRIKRK
jgi:hypothetical protein